MTIFLRLRLIQKNKKSRRPAVLKFILKNYGLMNLLHARFMYMYIEERRLNTILIKNNNTMK